MPYLYIVHGYKPSTYDPPLANGRNTDLMLARAQLNGGTAPLTFFKWNGQAFASAGLGGSDAPILPDGGYQNCGAKDQSGTDGTIDYVDDTKQYLLTFVCSSPTDPATGQGSGLPKGEAWFWSASSDVSDPRQWSTPQEITGSWSLHDSSGGCPDYKGWYPTMMSLGARPGHLSKSGYVFYLWGCEGAGTPGGRQYASRAFAMTLHESFRHRSVSH